MVGVNVSLEKKTIYPLNTVGEVAAAEHLGKLYSTPSSCQPDLVVRFVSAPSTCIYLAFSAVIGYRIDKMPSLTSQLITIIETAYGCIFSSSCLGLLLLAKGVLAWQK